MSFVSRTARLKFSATWKSGDFAETPLGQVLRSHPYRGTWLEPVKEQVAQPRLRLLAAVEVQGELPID